MSLLGLREKFFSNASPQASRERRSSLRKISRHDRDAHDLHRLKGRHRRRRRRWPERRTSNLSFFKEIRKKLLFAKKGIFIMRTTAIAIQVTILKMFIHFPNFYIFFHCTNVFLFYNFYRYSVQSWYFIKKPILQYC